MPVTYVKPNRGIMWPHVSLNTQNVTTAQCALIVVRYPLPYTNASSMEKQIGSANPARSSHYHPF